MSMELRLAQKLEAVGRLAAGIAHEINTPIQFVGDGRGFPGFSPWPICSSSSRSTAERWSLCCQRHGTRSCAVTPAGGRCEI